METRNLDISLGDGEGRPASLEKNHESIHSLEAAKAYLTYLAGLYEGEEPGHFEYLSTVFGYSKPRVSKRKRHQIRITEADFKAIKSLLHYIDAINLDDESRLQYPKKPSEDDSAQATNLPIWLQSFMGAFIKNGDRFKRFSDFAEDSISSIARMPNTVLKISDNVVKAAVGGINLGNTSFEFIKACWETHVAYKDKDAEFRPENLIDAVMRIAYSSMGIIICSAYLAGFLLTPFALAGLAIITMPIYVLPVLKSGYMTWVLKEKFNESDSLVFKNERNQIISDINNLETELKELAKNDVNYDSKLLTYHEKKYQLACMDSRIANDEAAYKEAKHELIMSSIELGGYLLVAAGSFLGLALFLSPLGPIAASIAFGCAVAGVAIITLSKFLPPLIERAQWAHNLPHTFWGRFAAFFKPREDNNCSKKNPEEIANEPTTLKAYKLLEDYAASSNNTYGKVISETYYHGPIPNNTKDCSSAVAVIKNSLNGQPVWKDGDLHKIIKAYEKLDNGKDYSSGFIIQERPSLTNKFFSMFATAKKEICIANTTNNGCTNNPKNV